ncbi:hypothetical protein [Caballeronia novacaledonica]|uniref:Glycosyltransferase family 25 (LPS biosynthesis protein) n=1 Tax=Caballeronia novacaledonica TaxID=1544861 RepID=A0AA37MHB6_9BURK|nr:hypothetical protein [Caballeronia novacaledonica]GJH25438.1 hypothetical protein CBA19CS42_13000 [Caballeronia novacaledonica]
MQSQLEEIGLAQYFQRFRAVDGACDGPFDTVGQNGVWACRRSHERIILESDQDAATIILEDDVELSRYLPHVINEGVIENIIATHPGIDMFFLDCAPFQDAVPQLMRAAEANMPGRKQEDSNGADRHEMVGVAFPNAHAVYAFCSAAYVVTPKGKETLRKLFEAGPDIRYPIDILYRDWIASGALNANITVPFLATPRHMSTSTIAYDELDQSQHLSERKGTLMSAIRRLLFAGDPALDVSAIEPLLLCESRDSSEYRFAMRIYESMWWDLQ